MRRIAETFARLKTADSKAFIPYITAGDPSIHKTLEAMRILAENGADIIEVGVPFSDPMADGTVIQSAMQRGLISNTHLKDIFMAVADFRKKFDTPIVLMGYANPYFLYGYKKVAKDARKSGVDALLVVDCPPEESTDINTELTPAGLDRIMLVTPVTTPERMTMIRQYASGFAYFVSVTGVTGERTVSLKGLSGKIANARKILGLPVALGFGISGPDAIHENRDIADAFVVGSAVVRRWDKVQSGMMKERDFTAFVKACATACHEKTI